MEMEQTAVGRALIEAGRVMSCGGLVGSGQIVKGLYQVILTLFFLFKF